MELTEVINKRKSIRGYKNEQITEEELESILDVANKAPNAGPFQLTVIQDQEFLKEVNDTAKAIMLDSEGFYERESFSTWL